MSKARLLEVADAAVALIGGLWAPVGMDEVSRQYLVPIKLDLLTGRKVYVFPASYHTVELATRGEDLNEYRLAILIVERYADTEPRPPVDWIDTRVNFVEQTIWTPLRDPRQPYLLDSLWPTTDATCLAYDFDRLNQNQVFWSEIEIAFREIAAPGTE